MLAKHDQPFRIVGTNGALLPNSATMYGLEDVRGTTPMTLALLDETSPLWCNSRGSAFANLSDLTRPMLSMMNVRYAISYAGEVPPASGWHEVIVDAHTRLLENERVLPRAFVPKRIVFGDDIEAMKRVRDFGEVSWVAALPASRVAGQVGRVIVRARKLGYDLDATLQTDSFIIISEAAWRGWTATIDGKKTPVLRANHAFLAVRAPAGNHRIKLIFRPRSFVAGRAISLVSLLLLAISCRLFWRWRNKTSAFTPATPR